MYDCIVFTSGAVIITGGKIMREINEIRKQFANGEWKKFLKSIKITNLRGWNGQSITFKYPVVAIVGENGMGKSTILRAAACAYKNKKGKDFYPSNFFVKTLWDKQSLDGATIEYSIVEGNSEKNLRWRKTNDWGYKPKNKKPQRYVYFFDISRTLPLDATAGYARLAKLSNAEGKDSVELNEEYLRALSYVLGKNYLRARFTNTDINDSRTVGLLQQEFGEVSQFHQGAGEDAMLDFFKVLQTVEETSLVIIDEVEASLHPTAQRRLIRYLLKFSRQKKVQFILSTHSKYILEELPSEARILILPLSNGKDIVYDVSPEFALNSIDDIEHPDMYVFVEDNESRIWLSEIIRSDKEEGELLNKRISIREVGPSNVVAILGDLSSNKKLPYKSISMIDGDHEAAKCLKLPGTVAPERVVFEGLKNKGWDNLDNRFGIGAGTLYKYLDDAMLLPDHHDWTTYVGDKVKKSKDTVWVILTEEWCKQCLNDEVRKNIINVIKKELKTI